VTAEAIRVPDDVLIHRVGGGAVANLELKPAESRLTPPGISTLQGGTPAEAAEIMRQRSRAWPLAVIPS
jgi:anthranilate phosphoribosyltransferase